MNAEQSIADLDAMIAENGEDVFLRDLKAPSTDPANNPGKLVRAFVRGYRPDELAGGIQQGNSTAVISPTSLEDKGITGLKRFGKISIAGRLRNIEVADPVRNNGVVVRWNLWVTG
jgi:hypothetical protein